MLRPVSLILRRAKSLVSLASCLQPTFCSLYLGCRSVLTGAGFTAVSVSLLRCVLITRVPTRDLLTIILSQIGMGPSHRSRHAELRQASGHLKCFLSVWNEVGRCDYMLIYFYSRGFANILRVLIELHSQYRASAASVYMSWFCVWNQSVHYHINYLYHIPERQKKKKSPERTGCEITNTCMQVANWQRVKCSPCSVCNVGKILVCQTRKCAGDHLTIQYLYPASQASAFIPTTSP